MSLFLLTFFTLYTGMHIYAFLKIRNALNPGTLLSIIIGAFMVMMIIFPILIRMMEWNHLHVIAKSFAYVGYTWMAFIFLFFSISILFDAYNVLSSILKIISINPLRAFLISSSLTVIILIYGYFEALNIRVEKVTIRTERIHKDIRIVQISDLHAGIIVGEKRVKRVIDIIKRLNPDIIISTGDLVDGITPEFDNISSLFNELKPVYGKFAITGNHEFYAGLENAISLTEKAGFRMLRGEGITHDEINLNIVGVDDPAGKHYGLMRYVNERELLLRYNNGGFTILMKHRPLINRVSTGLFHLQVSGHTHKGQIFPFSIFTRLFYPTDSGCLNNKDGCYLYVSRGTGTWGPPIRFMAPPEVTLIELLKKP